MTLVREVAEGACAGEVQCTWENLCCRLQRGLTGSQMEVVGGHTDGWLRIRGELDGREVGDLGHVWLSLMVLKCLRRYLGGCGVLIKVGI